MLFTGPIGATHRLYTDFIESGAPGGDDLNIDWDFDNRMREVEIDDGNDLIYVSHQYDALGRRVARQESSATNPTGTTTVYVQSGQQTIADYTAGANSSSPLYQYVYGIGNGGPVLRHQAAEGLDIYCHSNERYSVTALTNVSGTILERYAYTAYGTPTIADASGTVLASSVHNNRYTYTGREWDKKLALVHYDSRTFAPTIGRFVARDSTRVYLRTSRISEYSYSIPLTVDVAACRLGVELIAAG